MRHRVSVTLTILAIVFGAGGFSACKKEKGETLRESGKNAGASQQPGLADQPSAAPKAQEPATAQPGVTRKTPTPSENQPAPGTEPAAVKALGVRVVTAKDAAILKAKQELLGRWKGIRSFSATLTTSFEQREGNKMRFNGLGTYDYMTKDGKTFIRSKQGRDVHVDAAGVKLADGTVPDEIYTGQRLLKILDGEYIYEIDERHENFGGTKVTKLPPDPRNTQFCGGEALFRMLEQSETLILLPDETLDGKNTYVFESVNVGGRVKTLYYFDKETGILLKTASVGTNPALTSTFALSEIKLNVDFDDDHFKFVPPPGVEVQDLTAKTP